MKNKKINPDEQPVSRKCMKKLAEIVGPLMVIMIVAQITTTFFIIKYLPGNDENIPTSILNEISNLNEQVKLMGENSDIEENERDATREEPEEPEEPATQEENVVVKEVIVEKEVAVEKEPTVEVEQELDVIQPSTLLTPESDSETTKDLGAHPNDHDNDGLVRVSDENCPSGYALMDARLEKNCE